MYCEAIAYSAIFSSFTINTQLGNHGSVGREFPFSHSIGLFLSQVQSIPCWRTNQPVL
jgi:hypothetical protein